MAVIVWSWLLVCVGNVVTLWLFEVDELVLLDGFGLDDVEPD